MQKDPTKGLRKKFGVVFQNDVIYADTLPENISLGHEIEKTRAADEILLQPVQCPIQLNIGH